MAHEELASEPEIYKFSCDSENTLKEFLLDRDKQTIIFPVMSVNDLTLNASNETQNGYHYTLPALNQLCHLVAPGLSNFLPEIAGMWREPGKDAREYSISLARQFFNEILKLRFDRRLLGVQLVCNVVSKLVDGVVGPRYRYLANSDFHSRVRQAIEEKHSTSFLEGGLLGRHLFLRYCWPNTRVEMDADDTFAAGVHFANSEVGGASVRAALIIARERTGDCALGPYQGQSGGRVVHSGVDFERNVHKLLSGIMEKTNRGPSFASNLKKLQQTALGLAGPGDTKRIHQLSVALARKKLTLHFIRRVISIAVARGSGSCSSELMDELPEDRLLIIRSRNAFDLFTALINEARNLSLSQRELAEQVAYAFLSGNFSIN